MRGLLSIVLVALTTGIATAQSPPPNIVFIMADDLGWGDLGCYGNPKVKTPVIDKLAQDGMLFGRYYTCAAVCSPARAAIVTGKFPPEVGVYKAVKNTKQENDAIGQVSWLPLSDFNVGKVMQQFGYATAHFGKWHLGGAVDAPTLDEYGYDESRSYLSAPSNLRYQTNGDWWWESSAYIVDDAIAFMADHVNESMYVQVWLKDPHAILDPTAEQAAAYTGNETADTVHGWTSARHAYWTAVTNMDYEIGRLLAAIDDLGLTDDTIVIFTSDNGPESQHSSLSDHEGAGSAGPFRGQKRSLYEGGLRVPMIVRWPGVVEPGSVTYEAVAAVDWLPTFVDMLVEGSGLLWMQGFDGSGETILPLLEGQSWERSVPIFVENRFGWAPPNQWKGAHSPGGAVIFDDLKYLQNRDRSRPELYDLLAYPPELDNIHREMRGAARLMQKMLEDWQDGLGACLGCDDEGDNAYPWP